MDTFSHFFFFIIYYLSAYYFPRILDAILRFIKLDIFRYIPLSFYYFKILGSFHTKKYSQTWSPLIDICRAQSVILYPNANDLSSIFLCQSSEIIASRQKHNRPKMSPVHSTFVYALFQWEVREAISASHIIMDNYIFICRKHLWGLAKVINQSINQSSEIEARYWLYCTHVECRERYMLNNNVLFWS